MGRALAGVLSAGLLAVGLAACQRSDRQAAPIPPTPAGEGAPSQEIGQFTLRETDAEGRLTWVLHAATAQIFEEQDQVHAETIHIDFFRPTGERSSVLTADRGIVTRRNNDMRALGHVVVRNADGHELLTEELAYDAEHEKIMTEAFVTLNRGRDVLTGYGLIADPDLAAGTFEIQRDVRATVRDVDVDPGRGGAGSAPDTAAPGPAAAGTAASGTAAPGPAAAGASGAPDSAAPTATAGDENAGHP